MPDDVRFGRGIPWERRAQIGFWTALVETTQQVLFSATGFFRRMPLAGGLGGPLLYTLIVGCVGLAASAVYDAIFRSIMGPRLRGFPGPPELERFLERFQGGLSPVFLLVLGPFAVLIRVFLFSAITHLVLLLLGAARRTFEATLRVACYAGATYVLEMIPFCGGVAAVVYYVVLAIIGLAEAHGISRGRAAAAVLLPLLLVCCCCVAALALAVFGLASVLRR